MSCIHLFIIIADTQGIAKRYIYITCIILYMKSLILVLFTVLVLTAILTEGKTERQPLHITALTIKFDRADAVFTVDYDIDSLPKMYLLLIGSKSLEPKIKSIFSNFEYKIIKMDQNRAILNVKNISRLDKGYYLH